MDRVQASGKIRKRKAENQDNDRLSKRLSLLNLEHNGQRLYVPVEQPTTPPASKSKIPLKYQEDDTMQLDDTKHKVYIYDLDAELSDSSESDDGKLIFLPDIEKHLRASRIPPSVLANSDGELAGMNSALVLYNIPSSLTIPEEQDSVRKAIIETRARVRAKHEQKRNADTRKSETVSSNGSLDSRDWLRGMVNGSNGNVSTPRSAPPEPMADEPAGVSNQEIIEDLDAMDMS